MIITRGDDARFEVELAINGKLEPAISGTVHASIVDQHRSRVIVGPLELSAATPGSDWSNRTVITLFGPLDTVLLSPGPVVLCIQTVEESVQRTWYFSIKVVRGSNG